LGAITVSRDLEAQERTGRIEGQAVSEEARQPLAGIAIRIENLAQTAVTDADGRFRFTDLPAGSYVVLARAIGRVPVRQTVVVSAGETTRLDLALANDPLRLTDVVVTASRDEEKGTDIPANIGVVGGHDIELTRPHHSAEIVNRVPGVLNINLGGEGSTVAMRLPINYSAVYGYLEDGIPIRSTGFFNHNALYEINVPGASRVEVFKGPATALYGSDAIGGVFNVLTRAPSSGASGELFAEASEYGYRRVLGSASNTWGSDGVRADLNVMHFSGWRDGANQDRQTGTIRWDHALKSGRLKTVISGTNIKSPGDGGSDIPLSDFENHPGVNYTPVAFRKVEALRWSTAYTGVWGASSVEITGYARYNRLNLLPSWQLTYDPQVWDSHNKSAGLMTKYRRDFSRGNLIVGVDADYSPGDRVIDQVIPTTSPNYAFTSMTIGTRQYDYDVTFKGLSPYAQIELAPIPALHLSAGLRFDQLGYSYDNKLSVVDTGSHRRPASTSVSYSHVSPKLGITYDISSSVNVFASYRHGFRVPSEDQLFVQGSSINSVGLEPVRANSFEAGLRTRVGDRVSLQASAYTMDITDDIVSFYNTASFTQEVSNAGRTRHRGVEVGVYASLTDRLRFETAYSYVRNKYLTWVTATGTDYSGNEQEAGPRHIANTRLTYDIHPGSAVSAEWSHVGGYFTDPENLHSYDGYDVFNLEATTPSFHGLSIVGRLANVTNKRYAVTASYNPFAPAGQQDRYTPGMPRTFYLGLQYRGGR
jgi:outer membrane receptor protein involved in Fe transport